ncbi:MAG: methionyl-tRNA formyltransferase [Candidatus Wildermuthbacteria bacterium RIFCSPHIGHO2_12_FULL_45_9]|uniref:Methionyl-tRNA formyltransferase n=1 Tax=Candidatus Wildermuthbacteria bacterium RIFCSPHIGHO2_02_FULL_45_25 TaxID=1802450 RepID=A0A1G2QYQ7_9BACT|nr:MAG: methionyl-tRNA formyltransferase [Candidatus Wildermuthbacteria bacterium RIFCSPHIGHO2_01_FULL_45_20]OHA65720.1 MAG: methionyl-tRNA formyltransferase [Candidatus Wildermuthbacteria bacterium RIFCSPHIGHO2_02_FULL_45_25]OHA70679.1 MAG: methionyl-tRNA formyltransferase [Candidatus Wildermuthbacteria bacterium RIFCSPHIGHO2_12_FULL_45_9]
MRTRQYSPSLIFFGTSEFGAIVLEKLVEHHFRPVLVVTTPDRPAGRGQKLAMPPVKTAALAHRISLAQPEKIADIREDIHKLQPDLIILAAYGKFLPPSILSLSKFGPLNVHPSLLPKFRGPSPIQSAILEEVDTTGVSIMLMDEEIDHGPLIAQEPFSLFNREFRDGKGKPTYAELHDQLAQQGGNLLADTIPKWMSQQIQPQEQNHAQATLTKRFTKEDGHIDWKSPAGYIERQVRAFQPWPGAFGQMALKHQKANLASTEQKPKILKILRANTREYDRAKQPGLTFRADDGSIEIQTGKGMLAVQEIQLEGKKSAHARDFLLGYPDIIGTILT